jgi:hypothetical protein
MKPEREKDEERERKNKKIKKPFLNKKSCQCAGLFYNMLFQYSVRKQSQV